MLILNNLIDCIIGLPEKLFLNTQIPVVIMVFNREKKDTSLSDTSYKKQSVYRYFTSIFGFMQLHSSRLFLYRHPNNMLGRCLQILFSEHCINIRKCLAAVEFLCDLAGDGLQTHHFLPQIRMMVIQMP